MSKELNDLLVQVITGLVWGFGIGGVIGVIMITVMLYKSWRD